MTENELIEVVETFTIHGVGDTEKEAVEMAFKQLPNEAFKHIDYPIIHMVPSKVHVKESREVDTNEAFLYLFMKRIKKTYDVILDVEVIIKYIQI